MEEKKTLKEIIREAGIEGDFACDLCESLYGFGCTKRDHGGRDENCDEDLANELIKAIDREYIERPKFEDGEPVHVGDKYQNRLSKTYKVVTCSIDLNGGFELYGNNGVAVDSTGFQPGERVKRPEPEVVGADGKPIKVGETVYAAGYDRFEGPCEVTELKVGGFATVRWNDNSSGAVMASRLTHECPDTLERIQQDAKKHYCEYWGCGDDHCANCHVLIDGKTPADHYKTRDCINAMMYDLLARQRKVLERDAR